MWRRILTTGIMVLMAGCGTAATETETGQTSDASADDNTIVELDGCIVGADDVGALDGNAGVDAGELADTQADIPMDTGPPPECLEDAQCEDDNPCTDDRCVEQACLFEPNEEPCDDGDACTLNDVCSEGACLGPDALDCDDQNACSVDSCNNDTGCYHWFMVTQECRPHIVVDYPERAASLLWEDLSEPQITVTGTVSSGAGPITELLFNGEAVEFGEDGSFNIAYTPTVGGNTLEFDTKDVTGSMRKRVQSFHWAPGYLDPKEEAVEFPCDGVVVDDVCITAYLPEEELKWSPANENCKASGGTLAVLTSKA